MKVQTADFPVEGKVFNLEDEGFEVSRISVHGPVSGTVRIDKSGDYFLVHGEAICTVILECARCLDKYQHVIHAPVDAVLVSDELFGELDTESVELTSDDLNVTTYSGDEFDPGRIIEDQILLALPMQPVCDESCSGICPQCGVNRNVTSCQCEKQTSSSPFEALRNLRVT